MTEELQNINTDAELVVLDNLYMRPEFLLSEYEYLKGEYFGLESHRLIFNAIVETVEGGEPPLGNARLFELLIERGVFQSQPDAWRWFDDRTDTALTTSYGSLPWAIEMLQAAYLGRERERLAVKLVKSRGADVLAIAEEIRALDSLATSGGPTTLSAWDILSKEWPEPQFVVDKILPVGISILAGKPKAGKSWMALQLASSIANGEPFIGYATTPGRVLYIALEDSYRRLNSRMTQQGWTASRAAHEVRFMRSDVFEARVGYIHQGGGRRLAAMMEEAGYKLIIIDTQIRALGGSSQFDPDEVVPALAPLQRAAQDVESSVLFIDHMPKISGVARRNPIDDLYGGIHKSSTVDAIIGLYKDPSRRSAHLAGIGRDILEFDISLEFDESTGTWSSDLDPRLLLTHLEATLIEALDTMGQASVSDIAEYLGQNKGTVSRALSDLEDKGGAVSTKNGRARLYALTPDGADLAEAV